MIVARDDLMNVNLRGAFLVAQEGCKRMVEAETPGSVINISSILGSRQGTSQTNYGRHSCLHYLFRSPIRVIVPPTGTAKAGVNYMTKNMALELGRNNIRINAVAPGYFNTEMNDEFFASDAGKAYLARIPPRR